MKNFSAARWLFPLLLLSLSEPAFSQDTAESPYREWIDYRDGEVSMAFHQIPVEVALDAIWAQTGLQIIVPSSAANKLLSLQLNRVPLEPAVQFFISNIGFKNFALMYDSEGQPSRAVVLGNQPAVNIEPQAIDETRSQPLTTDEQEKLENALQHWNDLKQEERGRIEDRLKTLPPGPRVRAQGRFGKFDDKTSDNRKVGEQPGRYFDRRRRTQYAFAAAAITITYRLSGYYRSRWPRSYRPLSPAQRRDSSRAPRYGPAQGSGLGCHCPAKAR